MNNRSINLYLNTMVEIKRRLSEALYLIHEGKTLYKATRLEAVYLQFRKIAELISFSTLVTNEDLYCQTYNDYKRAWRVNSIFERIEKLHPNFYPEPVIQLPHENPQFLHSLVALEDGFATKEDLISLWNKCNDIMHAQSPFIERFDYRKYDEQASIYANKIIKLLNVHKIKLYQNENLFLIQMSEQDKEPTCTEFVPEQQIIHL